MKSKITIDLSVLNSILRELKGIRKELKAMKGEPQKKPLQKRELSDPITTTEVLKILKVSPATLNAYEKKGLLQFHKEGQSKIYSEAEVRNFKRSKGRRKRLTRNVISDRFAA